MTAVLAVVVPFCLEGVIVAANARWYTGLAKPTFAPRLGLAVALSALVGGLLAWAIHRVLCRPDYLPDRPGAIRLLQVLLGSGLVWAWSVFASRHPSLGLAVGAVMVVVAALAAWCCAAVDRRAGLLMVPVLLATAFAAAVELSISIRN